MPDHGDLTQTKFALVDPYLTFTHDEAVPWYLSPKKVDSAYPWSTCMEHGNTRLIRLAYLFDTRKEARKFRKQLHATRHLTIVRVIQQIKVTKVWGLDEDIESSPRHREGKWITVFAKATAL